MYEELKALCDSCYWEWTTTYNGKEVSGYIVYKAKAPDDMGVKRTNKNSATTTATYSLSDTHIFLPAAGCRTDRYFRDVNCDGYYWSASLSESAPSSAWIVFFYSAMVRNYCYGRSDGYPVRPVHP